MATPNGNWNVFLVLAICASFLWWGLGCQKAAPKSAEEQAIERHEEDVKEFKEFEAHHSEQKDRKKFAKLPWQQTPAGPPTLEAFKFVGSLVKSGQLPDVENASPHLFFDFDPLATNYPLSRTFVLKMKFHDPFVNHYTVVKKRADAPWKLTKAWRTDGKGNVVRQYSVR